MSQIKTVVFDLGRVLIDFSFDPFSKVLRDNGATFTSVKELTTKIQMIEHETGQISAKQFLQNIQAIIPNKLSEDAIKEAWVNIFSPIEKMLELATTLQQTHQVAILSNTSELHWNHLIQEFDLAGKAHQLFASFELGVMKPDPKIYRHVEQATNSNPAEILFIDDLEQNITGAVSCGWQGIVHRSTDSTIAELNQLGVLG